MAVLSPIRSLRSALEAVPTSAAACWLLGMALLLGMLTGPLAAAPPLPAPVATQSLTFSLHLDADVYPDQPGIQGLRIQLSFDGADWQVLGMRSPVTMHRSGKQRAKHYLAANSPLPRVFPANHRVASLSAHVQPLGFVLVDMDSDNDMDVVVVHRSTGVALSAWRNLGEGRLEPLARHDYGPLSFPPSSVGQQSTASALDCGFAAGSGFPIRAQRLTRLNQMGQGSVMPLAAGQPTMAAPQESLGRAPPRIV